MNLFIYMVVLPIGLMLFLFWLFVGEAKGLPQRIRCKIGGHDVQVYDVKTEKGMGFFGGPVTTYFWRCRACDRKGIT